MNSMHSIKVKLVLFNYFLKDYHKSERYETLLTLDLGQIIVERLWLNPLQRNRWLVPLNSQTVSELFPHLEYFLLFSFHWMLTDVSNDT